MSFLSIFKVHELISQKNLNFIQENRRCQSQENLKRVEKFARGDFDVAFSCVCS